MISVSTRSAGISTWTVVAAAGLLSFTAAVLAIAVQAPAYPTLLFCVCVALLFGIRRRLSPSVLSPVHIVVVSYLVLGAFGAALTGRLADSDAGGGIRLNLEPAKAASTMTLLFLAALSVVAGAALFITATYTRERAPVSLGTAFDIPRGSAVALCAVPLVIMIVGYGPAQLWSRDYYIRAAVSERPIFAVGVQLGTAAVLALGYLWVRSPALRVWIGVTVAAYLVVFFSLGSRRLGLLVVLFAVGAVSANHTSGKARLGLLVAVVLGFLSIRLSLYLRGQEMHGLMPYVQSLPGFGSYSVGYGSLFWNVVISFPIIGQTAYGVPPIPVSDLVTSINPLPGGLTDWYEIAPNHLLNPYTPFAAVGELGNVGTGAVVVYFMAAGFVLAYLDRRMRVLLRNGQQLYGLALVGLSGLFLLFTIQYTLRSSTRMLYYALALDLAIRCWMLVRPDGPRVVQERGSRSERKLSD